MTIQSFLFFMALFIFIMFIIRNYVKKTNKMIGEYGIKGCEFVQWKGKMYIKGRVVGEDVQLLDFVSTRGLRSFFVPKSELIK